MIYFVGWGVLYVSLFLIVLTRYRLRLIGYAPIIIFALIAVFRAALEQIPPTMRQDFMKLISRIIICYSNRGSGY